MLNSIEKIIYDFRADPERNYNTMVKFFSDHPEYCDEIIRISEELDALERARKDENKDRIQLQDSNRKLG